MSEAYWVWMWFTIGQILHIAIRAQNIVRSPKNDCQNLKDFAITYGLEILGRYGALGVGMSLWIYSAPTFHAILGSFNIPLIGGTAFGYGFAGDNILESVGEKYPLLRRVLRGNGQKP